MQKTIQTIVLAALCLNFSVKAQQPGQPTSIKGTTTGKVISASNQEPLPGAIIKITNTNDQTRSNQTLITNDRGEFTINLPDGTYTLSVHYLSYKTKTLTIQIPLQSPLVITLDTDEQTLQEVEINAGYYTVKDRERTGSISRISAETIEKQPVSNPLMALQNRVPGMEITQLTGTPGGGFSVQIRGQNSITQGNDPLYVVDGIIYPSRRINTNNSNIINEEASPLIMINPSDIENIDILKDADATAIYGSRGANGVILITTKKGISGVPKINFNISHGLSQVARRVNLLNTEQYLSMRNEAFKNDGLSPGPNDYDVNGVWDPNKYTKWQDVFIGGAANSTNTSLNISGGTTNTNYLVTGSYYKEGTVFPGNFNFKRGGARSNLNLGSATSRLKGSISGSYYLSGSSLPLADPTANIFLVPNYPDLVDNEGGFIWSYNGVPLSFNPMASMQNVVDAKTNTLLSNAQFEFRIVKDLIFKTSFGYSLLKRDEFSKRPNSARNPANNPTSANRESQFGNNSNQSWIVEPQINYNVHLGKGKLDALFGMSFQESISDYRNITATNFSSDELMANIQSGSVFSISELSYIKYKYVAGFARLNYSLLEKYFINITGRRDGSSRFGPGKQFANFGAVGASWILSNENFIKENLLFLNLVKLRASYGVAGNDQINDYQYMQLYNSTPTYQASPTIYISRIANSDYAWETNRKAETSLQIQAFKNLVNFQVAYFINRSSNQLLGISLPPSVGSTFLTANLPAVVENTGWELEGTVDIIRKENWKWSSSINLTIPKNRLVSYPGLETSSNASSLVIGKALSIQKHYDTTVDTQTGLYTFQDVDGNGVRNEADRYLNTFVGQFFYGGFANSVSYKRFGLDFLLSFSKQNGRSVLNALTAVPGFFNRAAPNFNQFDVVLNRWQNPGDITDIPKFSTVNAGTTNLNIGRAGSQRYSDASFARLKNISLNYNVPVHSLHTLGITDVQVNLQAQNLFTITKYAAGDPEYQAFSRLPPLKTILLGLKLTL